jgi:alkylation response protein AidB-like acyl-CoA dehydrogenase
MSDPPSPLPGLLEQADELAARFAGRAAAHDRAGSFPLENIADLRAAGWAGLTVPQAYGGLGAGLLPTVRAVERLAMGDGSTALAFVMHLQTIGAAVHDGSWPPAVLAELCRQVVASGALVNACASEPELGSPSHGGLPRTVARRAGAGWSITGRKSFASLAPVLDYLIVPAALEGEEQVIGRFLVPRQPGVRVEENWDPLGMRATGSHDIVLEDVPVAAEALLFRQSAAAPDPNRATANAWFTLTVTAVYLGVAAAAQRAAARFARTRVPTSLGRPIATLDSVQRRLGRAELQLRAARALLHGVAGAWDGRPEARDDLGAEVVAAKVFVTNAAIEATDQAMRVVGGAAMRRDLPLERYFRDVRAGLFHPPSDDQALGQLGRLALERDAPGGEE